jgi:FAD-dependent urate hydroxylase
LEHLRERNIERQVIGVPTEFWPDRMPKGAPLKSDGFASSLYEAKSELPVASSDRDVIWVRSTDNDNQRIEAEHVIAATGFCSDVSRMPSLGIDIRSRLKLQNRAPELCSNSESSISGLFFVSSVAVLSFGPVLGFACGAKFTAKRVQNYFARNSRLTKR